MLWKFADGKLMAINGLGIKFVIFSELNAFRLMIDAEVMDEVYDDVFSAVQEAEKFS